MAFAVAKRLRVLLVVAFVLRVSENRVLRRIF
jgi:hypothetical protein